MSACRVTPEPSRYAPVTSASVIASSRLRRPSGFHRHEVATEADLALAAAHDETAALPVYALAKELAGEPRRYRIERDQRCNPSRVQAT
jgi:hypothetical protein